MSIRSVCIFIHEKISAKLLKNEEKNISIMFYGA